MSPDPPSAPMCLRVQRCPPYLLSSSSSSYPPRAPRTPISPGLSLFRGLWRPLLSEGDYCPWNQELQSGLWLEKFLKDEEDVGTFKGSSCRAFGSLFVWCVCVFFLTGLCVSFILRVFPIVFSPQVLQL